MSLKRKECVKLTQERIQKACLPIICITFVSFDVNIHLVRHDAGENGSKRRRGDAKSFLPCCFFHSDTVWPGGGTAAQCANTDTVHNPINTVYVLVLINTSVGDM